MNIQDAWEKALKQTEIVRPRVVPLLSHKTTRLPYVFLAESAVNPGDTVVRKGHVLVEKPSLVMPYNLPNFAGFDFEKEMQISEDSIVNFFLIRGISFPSLKYNHHVDSLDIFEGGLSKAIRQHESDLQRQENVHSGLVIGPEEFWPLSVLIFVGSEAGKSAGADLKYLFDEYRRNHLS